MPNTTWRWQNKRHDRKWFRDCLIARLKQRWIISHTPDPQRSWAGSPQWHEGTVQWHLRRGHAQPGHSCRQWWTTHGWCCLEMQRRPQSTGGEERFRWCKQCAETGSADIMGCSEPWLLPGRDGKWQRWPFWCDPWVLPRSAPHSCQTPQRSYQLHLRKTRRPSSVRLFRWLLILKKGNKLNLKSQQSNWLETILPVRTLLVSEGHRSRARIPGTLALWSPWRQQWGDLSTQDTLSKEQLFQPCIWKRE